MDKNDELEYNFTVLDDNGNEVTCDVISVIFDEKESRLYLLYTDYSLNQKDQFNMFLSELIEENGQYRLEKLVDKNKCSYLVSNGKVLFGEPLKTL